MLKIKVDSVKMVEIEQILSREKLDSWFIVIIIIGLMETSLTNVPDTVDAF